MVITPEFITVKRGALRPIPILFLIMLYSLESKKKSPVITAFFVTTVIGDIINVNLRLFNLSLLIYSLTHLMLLSIVGDFFKKKIKKEFLKFFLAAVVLFAIIFLYVIQNKGNSYYPIIVYGLTLSLAFAATLSNYVQNMILPNGILLIAIGLRILADAIYAVVLFDESNIYFDFSSLFCYLLGSYVFYKGFILKEKHE